MDGTIRLNVPMHPSPGLLLSLSRLLHKGKDKAQPGYHIHATKKKSMEIRFTRPTDEFVSTLF